MVSQHGRSLRGLFFLTLAVLIVLPILSGGALSAQGRSSSVSPAAPCSAWTTCRGTTGSR